MAVTAKRSAGKPTVASLCERVGVLEAQVASLHVIMKGLPREPRPSVFEDKVVTVTCLLTSCHNQTKVPLASAYGWKCSQHR